MTKFFKSALMLVAAMSASFSAFGEVITEPRSWDFTKGYEYEDLLKDATDDGPFWKPSTNGRVAVAGTSAKMQVELQDNTGKTLPGLEGIKFAIMPGSTLGISDNFFLQAHTVMYLYIPNVGKGDVIEFRFCSSRATSPSAVAVQTAAFGEVVDGDKTRSETATEPTDITPVKVKVLEDCQNLQINLTNYARLFDVKVIPYVPEPEPITTAREWDFTKGADHKDQVTDCEYWGAIDSSKGRTTLAKALEDQELPGKDGVLTGMEGLYFTCTTGAVYGINKNNLFQHNKITMRIPNCGKDDQVTVKFCTSNTQAAATITSENLNETTFTEEGTTAAEHSSTVKENGDVILNLDCGKGGRIYSVKVTPKSTSGIEEIGAEDAEVVATRYYNLMGAPVDASYQGLVIKVDTLANGKIKTTKIAQ